MILSCGAALPARPRQLGRADPAHGWLVTTSPGIREPTSVDVQAVLGAQLLPFSDDG